MSLRSVHKETVMELKGHQDTSNCDWDYFYVILIYNT